MWTWRGTPLSPPHFPPCGRFVLASEETRIFSFFSSSSSFRTASRSRVQVWNNRIIERERERERERENNTSNRISISQSAISIRANRIFIGALRYRLPFGVHEKKRQ